MEMIGSFVIGRDTKTGRFLSLETATTSPSAVLVLVYVLLRNAPTKR